MFQQHGQHEQHGQQERHARCERHERRCRQEEPQRGEPLGWSRSAAPLAHGAAADPAPLRSTRSDEATAFWGRFARREGRELERCVASAMRRFGWYPEPSDLEELVQEVYCRLLERASAPGLAGWPPAQLWAYLHRIARSVVVDELRSRRARKRGGARPHPAPPAATCDDTPAPEPRAPGPTAEERLLAREGAAMLRRRIRELGGTEHGARNLHILELAAIEGCTAAEISQRLAGTLSPSSVHTVLHRLRLQLTATPSPDLPAVMGAGGT